MVRPYAVGHWRFTGYTALVLSVGIGLLYLPGSPAALVWPWEWGIVVAWCVLGAILTLISGKQENHL